MVPTTQRKLVPTLTVEEVSELLAAALQDLLSSDDGSPGGEGWERSRVQAKRALKLFSDWKRALGTGAPLSS